MLYTISNNMVQVHSLDDLSTVVATASLSDPASSPGPEVWELIDMPNDSGSDGGASQPLVFIDAGSVPSSSTKDQSPASTTDTTTVPLTPGPTAGLFDPSFLGGVMVG
jgi:hypothetical protein